MNYYNIYNSNTYAGSANQHFFTMPSGEVRTGRVLYKITVPGTYNYSLLFSNVIDSTYSDGSQSQRNLVCNQWTIHRARIGICDPFNNTKDITAITMSDEPDESSDIVPRNFVTLTFDGSETKEVMPGEFFSSDSLVLSFSPGQYLCLEITFSGTMIPYHEESLLPVFVKEGQVWHYSKKMPFAGMIGCDRKTTARVAYLGDSITQGIGTRPNSYLHWNALFSDMLGTDFSFWNLGIGYGRANDAATNGSWMRKAKQNDIVVVCFGVNDIYKNQPEQQIKDDILYIVKELKKDGRRVVVQTIPPFDYPEGKLAMWQRINHYILSEVSAFADAVFDTVPLLEKPGSPGVALYGGHPNEEGCKLWAEALYKEVAYIFGK